VGPKGLHFVLVVSISEKERKVRAAGRQHVPLVPFVGVKSRHSLGFGVKGHRARSGKYGDAGGGMGASSQAGKGRASARAGGDSRAGPKASVSGGSWDDQRAPVRSPKARTRLLVVGDEVPKKSITRLDARTSTGSSAASLQVRSSAIGRQGQISGPSPHRAYGEGPATAVRPEGTSDPAGLEVLARRA